MLSLIRSSCSIAIKATVSTSVRSLFTTQQLKIKELKEYKEDATLIVEGVRVPSPRTELLVRAENIKGLEHSPEDCKGACYMCALNLDVKHTDVLILNQFVRSDGCMLPRRVTKLCLRQQKKIGKLVSMAQKAGLMINMTPSSSKKDPKKRFGFKKYNTYFDEQTIFMKRQPKPTDRFKR